MNFLLTLIISAQNNNTRYNLIQIDSNKYTFKIDSLDIIKFKSENIDSKIANIFIQGSGFSPIILNNDQKNYLLFGEFILSKTSDTYIVSKPGIPAIASFEQIDSNYNFKNEFINRALFNKMHSLNYYNQKIDILIKYLIDSEYEKINIIGVSQGGRIAATFLNDSRVNEINILSTGPLGRIDNIVGNELMSENPNYEKIDFYYNIIKEGRVDNSKKIHWGYTYSSWASFSKPFLSDLIATEKKVNIYYGTEDESCFYCYLYDAIPYQNSNVKVNKMEGYNHMFFKDGQNMNRYIYDKILNKKTGNNN